ncbi:hypothetical protein Ga0466249_005144 [Sporomusaceae bacterium BoRhaA]|nr:hypothetical protein [Pelorhabdus rhamnosifermentans]
MKCAHCSSNKCYTDGQNWKKTVFVTEMGYEVLTY